MPRYFFRATMSRNFLSAGPLQTPPLFIRRIIPLLLLSLSSLCVDAQIQVSQESRHHKVFENAWVRILDVHVPPGDTTLFHKHSTPSVFLVLTNTKTGSEILMEPEKAHFTDGNIFFESFTTRPRVHRVWNSDTSEFHVIDMELPKPAHQEIDPPLTVPGFRLLFDEKPVRGYRLTLSADSSLHLEKRMGPVMLIGLADMSTPVEVITVRAGNSEPGALAATQPGGLAATQVRQEKSFVKKGDYLFVPAGAAIDLVNKGGGAQPFAFFELK